VPPRPGGHDVTTASFKFRYAAAAFAGVLLAAIAVAVLFLVRHAGDAGALSAIAERASAERIEPESKARAQGIAAHAADSVADALRDGNVNGVAPRLQPFIDDSTVAAITVTARSGATLYSWRRAPAAAPGALSTQATAPVRTLVENIPGARTPETLASLSVLVEQAAPVARVGLAGRRRSGCASPVGWRSRWRRAARWPPRRWRGASPTTCSARSSLSSAAPSASARATTRARSRCAGW
jgi:hypothetical protein